MFTDRIFGALIALGFWEHLQDGVLESLGLGVSSSFPIRSHLSIWESGSGKAWTWPKSPGRKGLRRNLTLKVWQFSWFPGDFFLRPVLLLHTAECLLRMMNPPAAWIAGFSAEPWVGSKLNLGLNLNKLPISSEFLASSYGLRKYEQALHVYKCNRSCFNSGRCNFTKALHHQNWRQGAL